MRFRLRQEQMKFEECLLQFISDPLSSGLLSKIVKIQICKTVSLLFCIGMGLSHEVGTCIEDV